MPRQYSHHRSGHRRIALASASAIGTRVELLEPRQLLAAHITGDPNVYATIQSAVDAASAGATINVDAGVYRELVTVNKPLNIRGAQAGVDARSNIRQSAASTTESIDSGINYGNNVRSTAFYITANDVTIDGFMVQAQTVLGQYGAGIVIAPMVSGTHVLNNIVQGNVSGLFLANASATDAAIIQHNVFRNNNNPGGDGGRGIYTDGGISGGILTNVTIDGNYFKNNTGSTGTTGFEAALALEAATAGQQSNIRITNNVFDQNGKGVLAYNVTNLLIQGNVVTDSLDQASGALPFEGGITNLTITGNLIYSNLGPGINIDNKAVSGDNSGFTITGNNIFNNGINVAHQGLSVATGLYSGTMNATNNWWGSSTGPSADGPGTGDALYAHGNSVVFAPFATSVLPGADIPFWGVPFSDGVPIQAEDFDHGGEGVAYHDNDPQNFGVVYRPTMAVDLESVADTGAGFNIGWTGAGEWLNYTVNVSQSSVYRLDLRVASGQAVSGILHVTIDGQDVTGAWQMPSTGDYQNWVTISKPNISITSGVHVLRIVMDSVGTLSNVANINWLQLTSTAPIPVPAAPSGLTATNVTPSRVDLVWTNNATTQTGFHIDRSTDGITFSPLATAAASALGYSDTSVAPGTTYYYEVRAFNSSGDSTNSNIAPITTMPVTTTSTYISDLSWVSATTDYLTVQKDHTIKGKTITLRGATYAKGIGTHAVSTIVYNLGGQYSGFISDIGVDDEVAGSGSVIFKVVGDGNVLYTSPVLTNSSPIVSINVNVAGVQTLTLIATNGVPNTIDYDHADWAGARLSGAPAAPSAPTGLAASTASGSQVFLSWSNTASNQTGFAIDRSSDGIAFSQVGTVGAAVTTYTDSGLTGGTKYYYQVRATNAAGSSLPSNIASATTLPLGVVITYMSDLQWVSATIGWKTVQLDASNKGNPITLRGTTYTKGIGTHADSTIVYNLAGKYSTFQSDIGIDDEVNGQGAVDFQVIGDGQVLYDSGTVTGASAVQSINISVVGIQQLSLVVTSTTPGSIDYDHADWAGARLTAGA